MSNSNRKEALDTRSQGTNFEDFIPQKKIEADAEDAYSFSADLEKLTHSGLKELKEIARASRQAALNISTFLTAELPTDLHYDASAVPVGEREVEKLSQIAQAVADIEISEEFNPREIAALGETIKNDPSLLALIAPLLNSSDKEIEGLQLTSNEGLNRIVHLIVTADNPQKVKDLLSEEGTLRNLIQRIEPKEETAAAASKPKVSWKKALAALAPMAAGVVVSCTPTAAPEPTEAATRVPAATVEEVTPTNTQEPTAEPEPTQEEPEATETAVPSYLEAKGFSIISNTPESFKFSKGQVTFNFDILAGTGGPELPAEIDPEILYENMMQRFEIDEPIKIELKFDSAAGRYYYVLEENKLVDQVAEEPIEYEEGTHLFPFPNDIIPAQVFARADMVAWSRSGSNIVEQYRLERVEDTQDDQEAYQLQVVVQAGPPNWSFQEPEQPITYPVNQEEIERLGLEIPEEKKDLLAGSEKITIVGEEGEFNLVDPEQGQLIEGFGKEVADLGWKQTPEGDWVIFDRTLNIAIKTKEKSELERLKISPTLKEREGEVDYLLGQGFYLGYEVREMALDPNDPESQKVDLTVCRVFIPQEEGNNFIYEASILGNPSDSRSEFLYVLEFRNPHPSDEWAGVFKLQEGLNLLSPGDTIEARGPFTASYLEFYKGQAWVDRGDYYRQYQNMVDKYQRSQPHIQRQALEEFLTGEGGTVYGGLIFGIDHFPVESFLSKE